MKTSRQRFQLSAFAIAAAALLPSLCEAQGAAAQTWVRDDLKAVYFAPKAQLKVTLTHLEASDEYWDQLDVALQYDGASSQAQADELRKQYPAYAIRRAVMSSKGGLTLKVPALGISQELTPMPNQEGPYANQTLYVSKSQSPALLQALGRDSGAARAVSIEGVVLAEVPKIRTLERVELDTTICDAIMPAAGTLFDAIAAYPKALKLIEQQTIRYDETRAALKRSVLESCLDVPVDRAIGSFKELLALPAAVRLSPARPAGETRRDVPTQSELQLSYDTSVSLPIHPTGGAK